MARHYKRKTQRQSWNEDNMKKALEAVAAGIGKDSAVRQFGIPVMTLKRWAFGKNINATSHVKIIGMENRMYSLTTLDARCLACQFAECTGTAHNFSHQNKAAGKDWHRGFRIRHSQLHLRLPESTSVARAMGFNKPVVTKFFTLLKEEYKKYNYPPHRIFNVDETSLTDRGSSASAVMCASAAGGFIPPMLIFRRQKFNRELEDGPLAETIFACNKKGWMKLCVVEKCYHYDKGLEKWLTNHPGRVITDYKVGTIFCEAYLMACSPKNAIKGFQNTGIHQYKPDIFSEEDFAPAKTSQNSENGDPDDPMRMERLTHTPQPESHKLPPSSTVACPLNKNHKAHTKTVGPQPEMSMSSVNPENIRLLPKINGPRAAASAAKRAEPTMARKQRKKGPTKRKRMIKVTKTSLKSSENDDCPCLFCGELYKASMDGEGWSRCYVCHKWAHDVCAGIGGKR
ncbi:hypothetical protein PR048_030125 [Dryococelus australis]|uniref:HTH psq-type domain-containing protein n=1 Tax=Dryococelus australis TaxID=614101 RepID=A0ABQ9GAS9_9NEOP|nr:hypothetical protein PR048_030125 [Dryococelus australis]